MDGLDGQREAAAQQAARLQSEPLLQAWPSEYRGGGFRIEGNAVVLFAPGKPDLRLENAL
jgi:hypothetical protein